MKVRMFVSGSAAVLAVWLGATYVHEIPAKDYPELGRPKAATAQTKAATGEEKPALVAVGTASEVTPVAATTE